MSPQYPSDRTGSTDRAPVTRTDLERKNTEELFAMTLLGEQDNDNAWEAVSVLRLRGTSEVFEAARSYCNSDNPLARARGLSVLAQLGAGEARGGASIHGRQCVYCDRASPGF
jgi:hypothetical protein